MASVLFPFHALCATFRQRTTRVARRGRSRRRQHDVTRSASRENVTPLPATGHVLPMRRLPAATSAPSRRDQPSAPPPPPAPTPPKTIREMFVSNIARASLYSCCPNHTRPVTSTPPWRHFLSVYFAIKKRGRKNQTRSTSSKRSGGTS